MGYVKISSGVAAILLLMVQYSAGQNTETLTIGGYGELHYNRVVYDNNGPEEPGNLDFRRFGVLAGYEFNSWVSLQTELQLSHGQLTSETNGELSLIRAYVDLQPRRELGVRAGIIPVPVGIVNVNRDPASYHGVERTGIETWLIPTTWREAGLGVFGSTETGLRYQAYAMAGLKPGGISGQTGIRGARQNGIESSVANLAAAARVDYRVNPMFEVGLSYYFSTLNNDIREDATASGVPVLADAYYNLAEGHFLLDYKGFEARGLVFMNLVTDVADLNSTFDQSAGHRALGGYIEIAHDVLPYMARESGQKLFVFGRFESYDTHLEVVSTPRNNDFLRYEYTAGLTYRPVPRVAVKADFQIFQTGGDRYIQQINAGVAFGF